MSAEPRIPRPEPPAVTVVDDAAHQVFRVVVAGQIDLGNEQALSAATGRAVASGRPHVILDLAGCTFIDSTGLGVVLELHERVEAAGNRLTIVPGGSAVERVFALTGLRDALPFTSR